MHKKRVNVFGLLLVLFFVYSKSLAQATTTDLVLTNATISNASTTNLYSILAIFEKIYSFGDIFTKGFFDTSSITGGYKMDGQRFITASSTLNNTFLGFDSGKNNTTGQYNTGFGQFSLSANTTGISNTAFGVFSLISNTSGSFNTAFGQATLGSNTTGRDNTALGKNTLTSNTTGMFNTFVGSDSGMSNTTGIWNTGMGVNAIAGNLTGSYNTCFGTNCMRLGTTASHNTSVGVNTLFNNASGTDNVAIGESAGYGGNNILYANKGVTLIGTGAGFSLNNDSDYNTLVGVRAGYNITTGKNNTLLGQFPDWQTGLTTGSGNILIGNGVRAGLSNTGNNQLNIGNLIFGSELGNDGVVSSGKVGIGTSTPGSILSVGNQNGINFSTTGTTTFNSLGGINIRSGCFAINDVCVNLFSATPTGTTTIINTITNINNFTDDITVGKNINLSSLSKIIFNGKTFLQASTTLNNFFMGGAGNTSMLGSFNTGVGLNSLINNTTGSNNFAFGSYSLMANTTGEGNVGMGAYTLIQNTTGSRNTAIGLAALGANTTGSQNIAIGSSALASNKTGSLNTMIGSSAGANNISGIWNIGIGSNALNGGTTASFNMAIGNNTLVYNTTGSNNMAIGTNALLNNISATNTVAIGSNAGYGGANIKYSNQGGTYIGYQTGFNLTTGSDFNTLLGYQAGFDITTGKNNILVGQFPNISTGLTTGSGNILIGNGVRAGLSNTGDNQLNIGNLIFGSGLSSGGNLSLGNISIGTTTQNAKFTVAGTVCFDLNADGICTDDTSALSDERVKTNLATITDALVINEKLRPVYFDWKKENELKLKVGEAHSVGFVAQNIQKVLPGLDIVSTTTEKYLVLDYGKLTAILSAAISEITNINGIFKVNLVNFLSDAKNGIDNIVAGKISTKMVCISDESGEICVNKKQFENMTKGLPANGNVVVDIGGQTVSGDKNWSNVESLVLVGENNLLIHVGEYFIDLGAVYTDASGATSTIYATQTLDTSYVGTTTLQYVSGQLVKERIVEVVESQSGF